MPKLSSFRIPTTQFQYTKAAQAVSGLRPGERSVLVALTDYVDRYGAAFPSHRTLAERTGYCTRTIRRALKALEAAGYIRRTGRTTHRQGNSSQYYAVILTTGQVSGQLVQTIGQLVPKQPDTESALNRPLEQTKEQRGAHLVRQVEDAILDCLKRVIDIRRRPHLICLGAVSQWLFNGRPSQEVSEAMTRLFVSAEALRERLLTAGETLKSWDQLLQAAPEEQSCTKTVGSNQPLDPILEEVWRELPVGERTHPRARGHLQQLTVIKGGDGVYITSTSPLALKYVREHEKTAVNAVSERLSMSIAIATAPTPGGPKVQNA